jgi:phosphate transport system protein
MARDLRTIGTAMKMITDIERIGDLAVDVAKIGLKIEKEFGNSTVVDVPRMSHVAREMLREALQAYITRDLATVQKVVALEDDVDAMYRELRTQLFDDMRKDSRNVVADGWLLLAIHHVERIADHSLNIAERVYFMETGELYNFAAHRALLASQNSHEQQV